MFWVVDVGGTKIRSGIYDGHKVEDVVTIDTPKCSTEDFVSLLKDQFQALKNNQGIEGVGVASAGPINWSKGEILNPANLGDGSPQWKNFPLKQQIESFYKGPVVVDNDAAMTAWGYHCHVDPQCKDLVLVTLGTGIGVDAIVEGKKARAGQGMHPEVGHFVLGDEEEDFPTHMGNFPTIESWLSGYHFARRVGIDLNLDLTGEDLIDLSEKKDPKVMKHWNAYARRMAVALANIYLVYFPEKIILAGGFSQVAEPFYFADTIHYFKKLIEMRTDAGMKVPQILLTESSDELPLLGAGASVKKNTI